MRRRPRLLMLATVFAGACTGSNLYDACLEGEVVCDGCVDLMTDPNNCGACGATCAAPDICVSGKCACPVGETMCTGECVKLGLDSQDCGVCGNVCGTGQTCEAGVCECPGSELLCEGACVSPGDDPANCGGCGVACPSGLCVEGICSGPPGCSDGTREGFTDMTMFPGIAGCSGGWSVPGMAAMSACSLMAGNDSSNPAGMGCAAADLCATGFHVCTSSNDIAQNLPSGQTCADVTTTTNMFFATLESGPGCGTCSGYDGQACSQAACSCNGSCNNDVFGCGTMGSTPDSSCGELNVFSGDLCGSLPVGGWSCGSDGCSEQMNVTKTSADGGGVLCCANSMSSASSP